MSENLKKSQSDYGGAKIFAQKYVLAFLASAMAEVATYPLDLMKTRLQIQGEVANLELDKKKKKRGFLRTGFNIVRNEGFFNLWKGISPALYRHVVYSGLRMGLYEKLRDTFGDSNKVLPIWKSAIFGLTAGGLAQFTASPFDLVKVQLQMDGRRALEGKPARVLNVQTALKQIYKAGGLKALWKGCIPNVQRGALVNLGDLTTYDTAKRYLVVERGWKDNYIVHITASFTAGFTATCMGTPADVIKTRIMNQPIDPSNGRGLYYKNSIDCLRKTVKSEGLGALYKGFFPIWLRLGPWSLTFWLSYEFIRDLVGIEAF